MHTGTALVLVFTLLFPPLYFWNVFAPCVDCFDFEAAAAHEIGHVLGFDHPDVSLEVTNVSVANMYGNLRMTAHMDNATCEDPSEYVEPAPPPDESIMLSLSQTRAEACLSADDLEGLNFLYPTCSGARQPPLGPLCIKAKRNHGWLRFLVVVVLPILLCAAIALASVRLLNHRNISHLKHIEVMLRELHPELFASDGKLGNEGAAKNRAGGDDLEEMLERLEEKTLCAVNEQHEKDVRRRVAAPTARRRLADVAPDASLPDDRARSSAACRARGRLHG